MNTHPIKALGDMLAKAGKPKQKVVRTHDGMIELDGYGRCPSCDGNFSACVGVYHCPVCSEC